MKPDDIPQWAWDAANMAVVHAPDYTQRLHEDVARGLLEAERRGMERAAAMVSDHMTFSSGEPLDPAILETLYAIRTKVI